MQFQQPDWKVLLIGGPSGVGKTLVARQLGLCFGAPWLQVDDLRLSLIRSGAILPNGNDYLHFFETDDAWKGTPQTFQDGLIAMSNVMSPSVEVVIENHVDTNVPIIVEGDAIVPSLLMRPSIQRRIKDVRIVFIIEQDEDALLSNMLARGRGADTLTIQEQRIEAHAKWMYGQWLVEEARSYHVPVVVSRPWETLIERIVDAITSN